jgi:predicted RecA/RadA family phage recombinase
MAKNAIQAGDILTLDPGATVASGAVAVQGDAVGPFASVALTTGASGTDSAFQIAGAVINVDKTTGTAWTLGQIIYLKASTSKGITLSSGNLRLGMCVEAAASGATSGKVALYGYGASPAGSSVVLEGQGATAASATAVITIGAGYNGKVVKVTPLTGSANASVRSAVVAAGDLTVVFTASTTSKFIYEVTSTDVA